jgi:hypothetical protein
MGHRTRLRVPALLLPLVALASCGQQEAPMDTYELSGEVTILLDDLGGGEPVAGAHVTFTSDTRIVEDTTTDAHGRYRMRVTTDHAFGQVRAEAEGFSPNEATVYFDTPQRVVDIALRRAM